jgi:hypothetical protein
MAPVWPVLHRLLVRDETVPNAPIHEFWVQSGGSRAFVARNFDATSFSEHVR